MVLCTSTKRRGIFDDVYLEFNLSFPLYWSYNALDVVSKLTQSFWFNLFLVLIRTELRKDWSRRIEQRFPKNLNLSQSLLFLFSTNFKWYGFPTASNTCSLNSLQFALAGEIYIPVTYSLYLNSWVFFVTSFILQCLPSQVRFTSHSSE